MILDALTTFSDSQAITVDAISNVIDTDTDTTLKNIGGLDACFLVVQTDAVAFASGTSLNIKLVSDADVALGSPTEHLDLGTHLTAALTANKTLAVVALPFGDYERYVGLKYDATGTFTAGSITAFLTRNPQFWRAMEANNPASHN